MTLKHETLKRLILNPSILILIINVCELNLLMSNNGSISQIKEETKRL